MKINLEPGDALTVVLEGTDGEFRILYDYKGQGKLQVLADLPDDTNRGGSPEIAALWRGEGPAPVLDPVIYSEDLMGGQEPEDATPEPQYQHGWLIEILDQEGWDKAMSAWARRWDGGDMGEALEAVRELCARHEAQSRDREAGK